MFDDWTDRRGTGSMKWDGMAAFAGVDAEDGLPMWVADKDFAAPDFLQAAVARMMERADYGYFTGLGSYREAVRWWMRTRHDWAIDPDWISITAGIGNALAFCLHAFSDPGDEIVIFTPVYHEFLNKIGKAGRQARQCPLRIGADGRYRMDLDACEAGMTGRERMVLFSSPHNPAGRVWSVAEQRALADFCRRHDLVLVADEIHHDLVLPGHAHTAFPLAAPEAMDRTIMLTAASKTFSTAGARLGCAITPDPGLRARLAGHIDAYDLSPNLLGVELTRAAYSPEGAAYVDDLVRYLDGNRQVFDEGIAAIPGLAAMPMEATYLAWVDFSGTGMEMDEAYARVRKGARVAPSPGAPFGAGGESFMRFNIGTQRARVQEAVRRLRDAFADLQ